MYALTLLIYCSHKMFIFVFTILDKFVLVYLYMFKMNQYSIHLNFVIFIHLRRQAYLNINNFYVVQKD